MSKLLVYVVAVTFLSAAALAAPKAEIFGGYQLTHFDGGPNSSGWNAALTGNFNGWLGIRRGFQRRLSYWWRVLHLHLRTKAFRAFAGGEALRSRAVRRSEGDCLRRREREWF